MHFLVVEAGDGDAFEDPRRRAEPIWSSDQVGSDRAEPTPRGPVRSGPVPLGSRDHLGSCTMAGRWMLGYESLCLSLNISCSFS